MKRPAAVLAAAFAFLLAGAVPCSAAYVRGELVWKCDFTPEEAAICEVAGLRFDGAGRGAEYDARGGAAGDGALRFRSPAQDYEIKVSVQPGAPLAGTLLVEADVRGIGIGDGVRPWNGAKVMMPFTPPGGETQYPQTPNENGSFDWKTWSMVRDFGQPAKGPSIVLGLEFAAGEFEVDAVRIYRVREIPDAEVVPPAVNEVAARIPRGPYARGGANPAAHRGTMVGYRMEEDDVATLASWGANLIRLQIGGPAMVEAATTDAWFVALSNRLDWCGGVMDRCARHGIKVVLDLHVGPGCAVSKNAANLLPKDYLGHAYDPADLVRAWRIIASRFRDHPATYGYDLLNEPSVDPETWRSICRKVIAAIREIDPATPCVVQIPSVTDKARYRLDEPNIIYSPHFYSPNELTHCGVGGANTIRWSYPGYINGVWWDKEQLRVALKPWIEFQRAHPDAPILVGEFSCILWSKGADRWIRDCIELFEEYGWSWCYHAYREWPAWDVEYTNMPDWETGEWIKAESDTARKRELLMGLSRNLQP
ncbi:MAG: cellulase family glycosylhydrolase [Kiritimatiellae bacterium]|nr:cellulase family glycosylhydrolase [Kiritimatiellia bacterium]